MLHDVLAEVESFVDLYTQVRVHWSLGRLAGHQGRPQDALDHLRRAIVLLEATEDTVHLARAHISCAWSLIENGRSEEAGPYLDAAERLLGPKPQASDLAALRAERARAAAIGDGKAAVGTRARRSTRPRTPSGGTGNGLARTRGGARAEREVPAATEAFRRSVDAFERARKPKEEARVPPGAASCGARAARRPSTRREGRRPGGATAERRARRGVTAVERALRPRGIYSLRLTATSRDATRRWEDDAYTAAVRVDDRVELASARQLDGTVLVRAASDGAVEALRFQLALDDDHEFLRDGSATTC